MSLRITFYWRFTLYYNVNRNFPLWLTLCWRLSWLLTLADIVFRIKWVLMPVFMIPFVLTFVFVINCKLVFVFVINLIMTLVSVIALCSRLLFRLFVLISSIVINFWLMFVFVNFVCFIKLYVDVGVCDELRSDDDSLCNSLCADVCLCIQICADVCLYN